MDILWTQNQFKCPKHVQKCVQSFEHIMDVWWWISWGDWSRYIGNSYIILPGQCCQVIWNKAYLPNQTNFPPQRVEHWPNDIKVVIPDCRWPNDKKFKYKNWWCWLGFHWIVCEDVLNFCHLISLLPDPPEGWCSYSGYRILGLSPCDKFWILRLFSQFPDSKCRAWLLALPAVIIA